VNTVPKMLRKALIKPLHELQERIYTFVSLALFRGRSEVVKEDPMVCREDSSLLEASKR
jgi:hypothetical protein